MWPIQLAFLLFFLFRILLFSFHLFKTSSCVLVEMVKFETPPSPFPISPCILKSLGHASVPYNYTPWVAFVSNPLIMSIRQVYCCISVWYCYYHRLSCTIAPLLLARHKECWRLLVDFSFIGACLLSHLILASIVMVLYLFYLYTAPFAPSVHSSACLLTAGVSVYFMFCPLTPSLLIKLYLCSFLRFENFTIYFE
jgi:hypothetical protein